MKRINLLPKTAQTEVRLLFFTRALTVFWIWVLITLLLFGALAYAAKSYLTRQSAATAMDVETRKNILKSSDNEVLKQQVGDLNDQIRAINNLAGQHYYWSAALAELNRLLAADIHLDSLSLDRASGKVQIQGTAASRDSVLRFWSDIHKSAYFKNIDFPLTNLDRAVNDPFTFTFYVNPDKLKQK